MIKHNENYLIINGKQSVKLKSGSIRLKSYFKQLAVPFKIYADFEFLLKGVEYHIPCSFSYKVVCTNNKFSKRVVLYRGKINL